MAEPRRIDLKPWMRKPGTRAVMAALAANGAEARFVGGCVRDSLLDLPVKDIDIATHETPERVIELLTRAGIKAIPTGIEHGTITAVVGGEHFEITTLRLDVKTHGRRAEVAFTDDWSEDAARRDLTINALSLREDGTLFDPFGGLADLDAGRVRFVGDAGTRITEDHLRALRFFRFFAYYGRPPADAEALAAVEKLAHLLGDLSGERIWGELMRLLKAPDPAAVFQLMADHGVLRHLFRAEVRIGRLEALVEVEETRGIAGEASDPLRRLAALVRLDRMPPALLAERLKLSRRDRLRLADLAGDAGAVEPEAGPRRVHATIYRLGTQRFRDAVFLAWAEARAASGDAALDAAYAILLAHAAAWPPPVLPVRGADAVRLGLAPGPAVGEAIEAVEAWWIEEDFAPDRKACLARLEAVLGGGRG